MEKILSTFFEQQFCGELARLELVRHLKVEDGNEK